MMFSLILTIIYGVVLFVFRAGFDQSNHGVNRQSHHLSKDALFVAPTMGCRKLRKKTLNPWAIGNVFLRERPAVNTMTNDKLYMF